METRELLKDEAGVEEGAEAGTRDSLARPEGAVSPFGLRKPIKYLTRKELQRLFKAIEATGSRYMLRDLAVFHLAYYCGLRGSEVGLLQVQHWHRASSELYVTRLKGSRNAMIRLDPIRARVLNRYLRENPPGERGEAIFPSQKGGPIRWATVRHLMLRYGTLAGLPEEKRHFHVLKHTIAVDLLAAGVDVYAVKEHLGHVSIRSTEVYLAFTTAHRERFYAEVHKKGVLGG